VAKQTPNIKTDPTNQMQRRFAPRSHKTSIGSLASPRLSEPHSSSFDHSLNIITEATDSAAFANITCGIQGLSLSPPAPVEPQLHLLVKRRHELQSPRCSSTGETQMKAAHHDLTIPVIQPTGEQFQTDLHQVHKKRAVFIYHHQPFTWTRRAFIFDQSSGDVSERGVFFFFFELQLISSSPQPRPHLPLPAVLHCSEIRG